MLIHGSIILSCTMVFLLEDRVRLGCLEFGLKIADGSAVGAAIGSMTGIGEVVTIVLGLVTWSAPTTRLAYGAAKKD